MSGPTPMHKYFLNPPEPHDVAYRGLHVAIAADSAVGRTGYIQAVTLEAVTLPSGQRLPAGLSLLVQAKWLAAPQSAALH